MKGERVWRVWLEYFHSKKRFRVTPDGYGLFGNLTAALSGLPTDYVTVGIFSSGDEAVKNREKLQNFVADL